MAAIVMLSTVVFFVVSVLVSVGVLVVERRCSPRHLDRSDLWYGGGYYVRRCGQGHGRSGERSATNTGDLGMDMIAEQGMPLRNTELLLYSP